MHHHDEPQRLTWLRDYFEVGCLCILSGAVDAQPATTPDSDAAAYYLDRCRCSRHPEHIP